MRSFTIRIPVLVTFILFWLPAILFGTVEYGDIGIELIPPHDGHSFHGYCEFQIVIQNKSSQTRHVELVYPESDDFRYSVIDRIKMSATIPPYGTNRCSFFQPPISFGVYNLAVYIDGALQQPTIAVPAINHLWYDRSPNEKIVPSLLVGQNASFDESDETLENEESNGNAKNQDEIVKALIKAYKGGARKKKDIRKENKNIEIHYSSFPTTYWSSNWLGYTRYDGILLGKRDWQQMSFEQKDCIQRFVEAGGILTVLDRISVPEGWLRYESYDYGDLDAYVGGFGLCFISEIPNKNELTSREMEYLVKIHTSQLEPWRLMYSSREANTFFPIFAESRLFVRGVLWIMIFYAILVGPVNISVLSKIKKKIWILVTVPVISFITCFIVIVFAFLAEGGWGVKCRLEAITFLNEKLHRASSLGWLGLYSPLSIREGLHFSTDTELTFCDSGSSYKQKEKRSIDWSKDQHLDKGWIIPAVPLHFRVRKSEIRRERLVLRRYGAGDLYVLNALGAEIRRLHLVDNTGKWYYAENLPAGKEKQLKEMQNIGQRFVPERLPEVFRTDWLSKFSELEDSYLGNEQKGWYLAVLNGCPFIETGVKKVTGNIKTVVIGVLKENDNEG